MLVLTRRFNRGETILLIHEKTGALVKMTVLQQVRNGVRIGFDAPGFHVLRKELLDPNSQEKTNADNQKDSSNNSDRRRTDPETIYPTVAVPEGFDLL